ncbi:flagellar hook assembly protein FlgD [Sulfurivermis fontis]|jgi:flagellar basal-body rod modification protein FlgD|uniref:flagellar hook assembly protein FlgD n=1 Tax=Sulfurivermis fontis TaxID=1972068 RepID=UPI000FD877C0|nr:flagellar hook assembly protein FlgD [Sulfurivermis fontis]
MSSVNNNVELLDSLGLWRQETKDKVGNELGADDFMKLMIAQMQNQNPMDPMDNGDFIAQLAQFSSTSGIQDLNASFTGLAESLQSYQALQASGLVGRSVLIMSDSAQLNSGGNISGMISLEATTPQLTVGIYDQSGALVRRMPMGMQSEGMVSFHWDGIADDGSAVPEGVYEVRAEALIEGKMTAMGTLIYNDVESVSISSRGGVLLNLAGVGTVDLSKVYQIK